MDGTNKLMSFSSPRLFPFFPLFPFPTASHPSHPHTHSILFPFFAASFEDPLSPLGCRRCVRSLPPFHLRLLFDVASDTTHVASLAHLFLCDSQSLLKRIFPVSLTIQESLPFRNTEGTPPRHLRLQSPPSSPSSSSSFSSSSRCHCFV